VQPSVAWVVRWFVAGGLNRQRHFRFMDRLSCCMVCAPVCLCLYLLLLAVTLGVIGGALVFISIRADAPPEPTYQQLATLAMSINLSDVLNAAGFDQLFPTRRDFTTLTSVLSQVASDSRCGFCWSTSATRISSSTAPGSFSRTTR